MATRKYSVDVGDNYSKVTQASGSATTKGIELTVDLAKVGSKKDLFLAIEALAEYITRDKYKPA